MAMLSYHFAARIAQRKKDKELPRKGGAIINMSSMACTDPTSFVEPYCASKRFGQIFSTELSAIFGMDVDIICSKPGFVDTELEKRIPGNHTGILF
jgi:short-subunit dehydrogenase